LGQPRQDRGPPPARAGAPRGWRRSLSARPSGRQAGPRESGSDHWYAFRRWCDLHRFFIIVLPTPTSPAAAYVCRGSSPADGSGLPWPRPKREKPRQARAPRGYHIDGAVRQLRWQPRRTEPADP